MSFDAGDPPGDTGQLVKPRSAGSHPSPAALSYLAGPRGENHGEVCATAPVDPESISAAMLNRSHCSSGLQPPVRPRTWGVPAPLDTTLGPEKGKHVLIHLEEEIRGGGM